MKQGKNELTSDIATEDSDLREQLDIISQMEFLVKSGAVKHLIVAATLTAAKGNEIAVMTDDITLYDYHALIGYLQSDVTLRMLAAEMLEKEPEPLKLLA